MSKKPKVDPSKYVSILTHTFRNSTQRGKYFNYKVKNEAEKLLSLRKLKRIELEKLLDEIYAPHSSLKLPGSRKVTLKDLNSDRLEFINFDQEFYLAKSILLKNTERIQDFVNLSHEYSICTINGSYEDSLSILNEIENKFGYSIWLLKNKIALMQVYKGLEDQKKIVQEIKKGLRNGSLSKFLIHWISVRNEPQLSIGRYKGQIDPIISRLDDRTQKGFKEYLSYHLLVEGINDPQLMIDLVRLSYSDSIIDYYLAFNTLLKSIFISDTKNLYNRAISCLMIFDSKIKDPQLSLLHELLIGNNINLNMIKTLLLHMIIFFAEILPVVHKWE